VSYCSYNISEKKFLGNCAVVVPCYNEADRLRKDEFRSYLSRTSSASIVFVNDGSTDRTLALLEQLQSEMPGKADILHRQRNSGKGEAVRCGMLQALSKPGLAYLGFWDADLATPLDAVDDLLGVLVSHPEVDIVLGSRVKLMGRNIERRPTRHYLGRIFATCASVILGLPIYDTQCGAKLFRVTPSLVQVLQRPFLSRWIFDVELIARFLQLHAGDELVSGLIYEFPLHCWKDVPGSKLRPRDFYRAARDLLAIRRMYFSKPRRGHFDTKRSGSCRATSGTSDR
jgi:dolichyl-phosphate beta-glucosyltransferase